MPEEKKEQKKRGITGRISKWLGLSILSLLLIAAIYFQAPWKVIALLVVILLACTALPKPYRKWFWLSAAAVVIALIVWVFLPDETEGWQPYTFDEELAALEAKYAIPDEENAAPIYNQLLENHNEYACRTDVTNDVLSRLPMREPWPSKDHPELAEWLQKQQGKFAKLLEAGKIEKCRFPIKASIVTNNQWSKRSQATRHWAMLLVSAASNDIAEGRINQALEKYIAALQMGKHQCQQLTINDTLVGIAIEALVLNQLKTFVVTGDATEQRLSVIEEALAEIKHDWNSDFPRLLEHEKLLAKNFWGMFYAVNPEGKVRLNPGIAMRTITAQLPEDMKNEIVLTYWRRKLMKATTILAWFYMPSTPQKADKIIDASYERLYAMADSNFDWRKEPERYKGFSLTSTKFNFRFMVETLVSIVEPAYHSIHDTYLRLYANRRGSQITIALRRYKNKHNRWPESLDDVKDLAPSEIFVDPINGSSFVYKLTGDNFTLYSKGKNNIDEDGQTDSRWDPNTSQRIVEQDDFLIWPNKKRNTQLQAQDNDTE